MPRGVAVVSHLAFIIGIVSVLLLGSALRVQGQKDIKQFIRVERGPQNEVLRLHVLDEIPASVIAQLPNKRDDSIATKDKIRRIAEKYRLFERREKNFHLRFQDGDIAYFVKQNMSVWDVELGFLARKVILDAAEAEGARIPSKGDWSFWAEELAPVLADKAGKP